ncbi:SMP-30/gluconolactonase/LRE family protein [Chryseosolibacter indicus]|uniref:ATP-binding protein n=1 Tax=Chryseosolibacter indicus TaxID=2782351 RepID=A0ABS5VJS2_9BACT|nr:ATP-binding protein [Chryseosolibacter indicus]MBT1701688.1 ATP-binding protein [Chryseosolibacter indicus]
MKQLVVLSCVLAMVISACQTQKQNAEETEVKDSVGAAPVKLTLKWETDTVLTTCESVLYDRERDVLYAANINGVPDNKDGNGFISKVSLEGKVTEAQWVKGLNAPKGMGLFNSKLYVADIDRVVEIDVTSGKVTNTFAVEGAKFLNDVTVDSTGRVYVSDTGAGNIVVIENGKLSKWLENVEAPNGLLAEGNKLLMLSFAAKTFNTIDVASKQVTKQADGISNADGIEALGDGGYLVSSWDGEITHVGADFKTTSVLTLRADSVNSADIEYIQDKNLLLVPTFFKNTVRAYEVSK